MTEEQIKKGASLLQDINFYKSKLYELKDAKKYYRTKVEVSNGESLIDLPLTSIMDFEELKELTITRLTEMLKEKEKEFENL